MYLSDSSFIIHITFSIISGRVIPDAEIPIGNFGDCHQTIRNDIRITEPVLRLDWIIVCAVTVWMICRLRIAGADGSEDKDLESWEPSD